MCRCATSVLTHVDASLTQSVQNSCLESRRNMHMMHCAQLGAQNDCPSKGYTVNYRLHQLRHNPYPTPTPCMCTNAVPLLTYSAAIPRHTQSKCSRVAQQNQHSAAANQHAAHRSASKPSQKQLAGQHHCCCGWLLQLLPRAASNPDSCHANSRVPGRNGGAVKSAAAGAVAAAASKVPEELPIPVCTAAAAPDVPAAAAPTPPAAAWYAAAYLCRNRCSSSSMTDIACQVK